MSEKTGRNEPCHCGSGKKYKKCCLNSDLAAAKEARHEKEREKQALAEAEQKEREQRILDQNENFALVAEEIPAEPDELPPPSEGDLIWEQYQLLNEPTPAELEKLIAKMAPLPAKEEIPWTEILSDAVRWKSCNADDVFRQISNSVDHDTGTDIAFFYWRAAEIFSHSPSKFGHMYSEVAEGFSKLGPDAYDYDCLIHVVEYLVTGNHVDEALKLAEQFLPTVKDDPNLFDWVYAEHCFTVFKLRLGKAIREYSENPKTTKEEIKNALENGLADHIREQAILKGSEQIVAENGSTEWERSAFDLNDHDKWDEQIFLSKIRWVSENWQAEEAPPEKLIYGLNMMLSAIHQWKPKRPKKKKKKNTDADNWLNYLDAEKMEERIVKACKNTFELDLSKIKILVDCHEFMNNSALRHGLVSSDEAKKSAEVIASMRNKLGEN